LIQFGSRLDSLLSELRLRSVVCPLPLKWKEVQLILQRGNNKHLDIPNALILAGWGCSDKEKSARFLAHLKIAEELDLLPSVVEYLNRMDRDDFLYSVELSRDEPLNDGGFWNSVAREAELLEEILTDTALPILKKIQLIDPTVTDEASLFALFVRYDFYPQNHLKVDRGKSGVVDLLIDLADSFDAQRSFFGCSDNLEDFCFKLFDIKN
jgi:hypothetical protein